MYMYIIDVILECMSFHPFKMPKRTTSRQENISFNFIYHQYQSTEFSNSLSDMQKITERCDN